MLPAQARNVAQAGLSPPPPTKEFLERLALAIQARPPPADTALFGPTFAVPPGNPEGTEVGHEQAYRAVCEFQKVCEAKKVDFQCQSLKWPAKSVVDAHRTAA